MQQKHLKRLGRFFAVRKPVLNGVVSVCEQYGGFRGRSRGNCYELPQNKTKLADIQ